MSLINFSPFEVSEDQRIERAAQRPLLADSFVEADEDDRLWGRLHHSITARPKRRCRRRGCLPTGASDFEGEDQASIEQKVARCLVPLRQHERANAPAEHRFEVTFHSEGAARVAERSLS